MQISLFKPLVTSALAVFAVAAQAQTYQFIQPAPLLVVVPGFTAAPAFSLSAQGLTFGNVTVPATSTLSLLAENSGNVPIALTGITTTGDGFGAVSNCGATLAPTESCQVSVTFGPNATQSYSGTLSVSYDGLSAQVINLNGTGAAAATPPLVSATAPVTGSGPSVTLQPPFTVESWVKVSPTFTGSSLLFALGNYSNGQNWGGSLFQTTLAYDGTHFGFNRFYNIQGSLTLYDFVPAVAAVPKNTWHHVLVEVGTDNTARLAINGTFIRSSNFPAQSSPASGISVPTLGGEIGFSVANGAFWQSSASLRDGKVWSVLKYGAVDFNPGPVPTTP